MATVGYARVSTEDQNLDLQLAALRAVDCDRIETDHGVSGSARRRPGLDRMLDALEAGDVVVVWRLDRLGRSLAHLIELVDQFRARGVQFRSLCESIDTTTAAGELVFHMFGALAQFERGLIRERTAAGLQAARRKGVMLGRRPSLTTSQAEHAVELVEQGKSHREIGRLLRVSHTSVQRALARLE